MDTQDFYYAKWSGVILLIVYIGMASGFTYACTLPDGSFWGTVFMVAMAAASWAVIYYLYVKWVRPAFNNTPLCTIDENGIDLHNGYLPITWYQVDSINLSTGQYGGYIGIVLKDLDAYLALQPTLRKSRWRKLQYKIYKFHFGISTPLLRDNNSEVLNALQDYLNRYGKVTPTV